MSDRLLTPQQENFLAYYTDPRSETFSNALQSALRAGYSEEYANNITGQLPDWLSESLGDSRMIRKAEKNLETLLDMEIGDDMNKARLVQDTSKFVVERLNKKKYSARQELSDPEGKAIPLQMINITPIDAGKNT